MQLITILTPLALSTIVTAWNLDLYGSDGRHVNFHGRANSGCVDIAFTPAIDVNQANFDPATSMLPDPDSFELYVNRGCEGLSYRNDKGDHKLTPARTIGSYKVTGSLLRVRRMADVQERGEFDDLEEVFKRDAEAEAAPEPEEDEEDVEEDIED